MIKRPLLPLANVLLYYYQLLFSADMKTTKNLSDSVNISCHIKAQYCSQQWITLTHKKSIKKKDENYRFNHDKRRVHSWVTGADVREIGTTMKNWHAPTLDGRILNSLGKHNGLFAVSSGAEVLESGSVLSYRYVPHLKILQQAN